MERDFKKLGAMVQHLEKNIIKKILAVVRVLNLDIALKNGAIG
jgi:hypothetical protein